MKNIKIKILSIIVQRFFFILFIIILILPHCITTYEEFIDPFTFSNIGLAETYASESRFIFRPYTTNDGWQFHANEISLRAVPTLYLLILSQLSSIPLNYFVFFPLIGLLMVLFSYMLGRTISRSNFVASLFAITMSYNLFPSINIYYISVGLALFILFLFFWIKICYNNSGTGIMAFTIIMLVIFNANYLSYYTSEFLILCFLFWFLIFSLIMKNIETNRIKMYITSLFLTFLVSFVIFDNITYFYIQNYSIDKSINLLGSYFKYILKFFEEGASATLEYRKHISYGFIAYIDFFHWLVIALPPCIYAILLIKKLFNRNLSLNFHIIAFISLFLAGIIQILIYSAMGYGIHTWTLFLTLTLASILLLHKFYLKMRYNRNKKLMVMSLVILLLIPSFNVAKFIIRVNDPIQPNGFRYYSLIDATVSWVALYFQDGRVKTDLRTSGLLYLETVKIGKINEVFSTRLGPEVKYLYSFNYEAPFNIFGENQDQCFVISRLFEYRSFYAGDAWEICPPLGNAIYYLNYYPSINKVYADMRGLVYNY